VQKGKYKYFKLREARTSASGARIVQHASYVWHLDWMLIQRNPLSYMYNNIWTDLTGLKH